MAVLETLAAILTVAKTAGEAKKAWEDPKGSVGSAASAETQSGSDR